jgi:hypothetical protein
VLTVCAERDRRTRGLLEFLEGDLRRGVEEKKDDHLVGGDVELVLARAEEGLQVSSAHVRLPGQATAVVVGKVELLEDLAAVQNLRRRTTNERRG